MTLQRCVSFFALFQMSGWSTSRTVAWLLPATPFLPCSPCCSTCSGSSCTCKWACPHPSDHLFRPIFSSSPTDSLCVCICVCVCVCVACRAVWGFFFLFFNILITLVCFLSHVIGLVLRMRNGTEKSTLLLLLLLLLLCMHVQNS